MKSFGLLVTTLLAGVELIKRSAAFTPRTLSLNTTLMYGRLGTKMSGGGLIETTVGPFVSTTPTTSRSKLRSTLLGALL